MGKRQVHVIVVPKPATVALLVLVSAAVAGLVWFLSGKAYAAEGSAHDLLGRLFGASGRSLSRGAFLAFLMPVIANVLLFVPWGFLAFVALDRPSRPRGRSYLLAFLGALLFAAALYVWQQFLPTRVTTPADLLANGAGALGGAALGHMRKGVKVRFDF